MTSRVMQETSSFPTHQNRWIVHQICIDSLDGKIPLKTSNTQKLCKKSLSWCMDVHNRNSFCLFSMQSGSLTRNMFTFQFRSNLKGFRWSPNCLGNLFKITHSVCQKTWEQHYLKPYIIDTQDWTHLANQPHTSIWDLFNNTLCHQQASIAGKILSYCCTKLQTCKNSKLSFTKLLFTSKSKHVYIYINRYDMCKNNYSNTIFQTKVLLHFFQGSRLFPISSSSKVVTTTSPRQRQPLKLCKTSGICAWRNASWWLNQPIWKTIIRDYI